MFKSTLMQQGLFFLIFTVSVFFTASAQCEKRNELTDKEKYSVKVTTGYSYEDGVEKIDHIRTSKFDQNGRETSYIFQHVTDNLKKTNNTNYYDSNGNLVRQIRRNYKGEISDSLHYKYDENGNMIESAMWRGGSFDSYDVYGYDENCNMTSYIAYQFDSSLWFHYTYAYDSNNNLMSFTDVSHSGETEFYERDSSGNILSHTRMDKEGQVLMKKTTETEFDKNGRVILVIWKDESGKVTGKEVYTYKKVNLSELKIYEGDTLISYEVYDKRGNLILEETYTGGVLTWKTTQEFVYYK